MYSLYKRTSVAGERHTERRKKRRTIVYIYMKAYGCHRVVGRTRRAQNLWQMRSSKPLEYKQVDRHFYALPTIYTTSTSKEIADIAHTYGQYIFYTLFALRILRYTSRAYSMRWSRRLLYNIHYYNTGTIYTSMAIDNRDLYLSLVCAITDRRAVPTARPQHARAKLPKRCPCCGRSLQRQPQIFVGRALKVRRTAGRVSPLTKTQLSCLLSGSCCKS